jgi:hypothetical protein
VVNSTWVAVFSGLHDGLWLTRYDGFRERFIPLGNETSQPTSDVSQLGPPAVVLHIDDGRPSNNRLHRGAHLSTGNGFRGGVHNPDRSAIDSGCVENQGGEEESRG